ncbi:hypothetical protein HFP70_35605 [Streptomyces sp. ARC14]|uniref:hypothetical protein n=1 Tax=Streptomyces sp. ARC14 TaxID=2724152 RepID=UPI003857EC12
MDQARLTDLINLLPFERWLRAEESASFFGVAANEATTLLRAGRRRGMITVRRNTDGVEFMRVRRRPAARRADRALTAA